MNDLEETLRSTLGHAAERAPRPPSALGAQVETRFRRRRHRRQALAAAAAALVVVASGVTIATRDGQQATVRPATGGKVQPADKVWPEAVRAIPDRLPNGLPILQAVSVDGSALIVTTAREHKLSSGVIALGAGAIYAYDGHTARKITDVPAKELARTVIVGAGRVIWWSEPRNGVLRIWSAPLTGGTAEVVGSGKLDALDDLAVVGDRVMLSRSAGGVFSVPLAGGSLEPVGGSEGLHLLNWPWVGSRMAAKGKPYEAFTRIRNLETGQSDTALVRKGERNFECDLRHCTGQLADGTRFIRARDGSGQRPFSGGWDSLPGDLLRERFTLAGVPGTNNRIMLSDLTTGQSGELGLWMFDVPGSRVRLITYGLGKQQYVIDLSKIR